jgi:ABC-type Fe3+ transport system permease subunit
MDFNAILNTVSIPGAIGIVMGLVGLILLAVIAARLSRVNDLLDEIAELITTVGKQQDSGVGQPR